jgi:putative redox protein
MAESNHLATVHLTSAPERYAQHIRAGHHALVADEPTSIGGADAGPSPYALVLSGLGACTAITLRMYAERKGWDLGEVKVDLAIVRDGDAEKIERTIRIAAPISDEQRTRLAEIAEKTPVTKTIKRGTMIATSFAPTPGQA